MFQSEPYQVIHGDCIPHMAEEMPPACIDFSIFSPPFPSLYAYTSEPGDIGNSEDLKGEAKLHLSFFYRQLSRVVKPGRAIVVHVAQIPRMKRAGGIGLFDFRGLNIRLGERAGLVFDYDWVVRKNPQAQAIRGKAWELKFQGIETDRAMCRGALPDYLLKFRAPGENQTRVVGNEISRNDWINFAECCWSDIRETDTLNVRGTKGDGDTRHICPLQLGVIERLVRLFTNPGELVFSPFAGIGSEGYISLKLGRKFYGVELKHEYYLECQRNLERGLKEYEERQRTLFDVVSA